MKDLLENPSNRTLYMREWRSKNSTKDKEYQRAYRLSHDTEEVRAAARQRKAKYYAENTERCKVLERKRYADNRERITERNKKWKENNYERWRIYQDEFHRKRRAVKASVTFGKIDYQRVVADAKGLCGICLKVIIGNYEFDHIIPIARGGTHTQDNIQISHRFCNRSKGAKLPSEYK